MRFEIVIEDDARAEGNRKPWTANVYQIDAEGKSSDSLGCGFGVTAEDAVTEAITAWREEG